MRSYECKDDHKTYSNEVRLQRPARTQTLQPLLPKRSPLPLPSQHSSKLHHPPHILEVTGQPQANPHDAQLASDDLLEARERGAGLQVGHRLGDAEQSSGATGVAHAACAQGDGGFGGGEVNEGEGHHLAGGLNGFGKREQRGRWHRKRTLMKMKDMVDPVSA